jgi:hypothetical protein
MSGTFLFSRRRAVYRHIVLCVTLLCAVSVVPQQPKMSPPPPPLDPERSAPPSDQATVRKYVDFIELQREANDLARTAQTIPADVVSVRKGMLPKDVIEKLKQIEKLSKHLRSELKP